MTLVGWSSVPLFIAHFASKIDIWTSNGWRYAFSALLWAPVVVWGLWKRTLKPDIWRAALMPSVFNALAQTAFAWSFYNIDSATATFGLRLQIVFVAIGAFMLFPGERAVLRSPGAWAGMVLVLGGIAGTLLFADHGNLPQTVGSPAKYGLGVALSIVAGLLFACYGLSVRKCMHAYHPVTAFGVISQYTSVALVLLMFILARSPTTGQADFGMSAFDLAGAQFGLLLLSAVIGIALGHVFYYIAIARLGVAVSSGVMQLQPFCVAIGQLMMFNKPLTNAQWVCGVLAVFGAVMLLAVQWLVSREAARRTRLEAARLTCPRCGAGGVSQGSADLLAVEGEPSLCPACVSTEPEQSAATIRP